MGWGIGFGEIFGAGWEKSASLGRYVDLRDPKVNSMIAEYIYAQTAEITVCRGPVPRMAEDEPDARVSPLIATRNRHPPQGASSRGIDAPSIAQGALTRLIQLPAQSVPKSA